MERIFTPTLGPTDWRRLVAEPKKHWKVTRSAFELAVAWEAAKKSKRGLPGEVQTILDSVDELRDCSLLIALPEHQVSLDGGGHASQTDLWALLKTPRALISLAIEAKAGESFDKMVPEWLEDRSAKSGKPARLGQLCEVLQITEKQSHLCRYQLLHRGAAAILEATRFGATLAVLLVHSFASDKGSLNDYECFGDQLGVKLHENTVSDCGLRNGVRFFAGWLSAAPADCKTLAAAL